MPSDKIHKILDAKTNQKSILQFEQGTDVNLNEIKVGDQIYYLYKAEEDESLQSWYWGCVTEIDMNRDKKEYYHIFHDDEYPWIDLSEDKTDWARIPKNNVYYDKEFNVQDIIDEEEEDEDIEEKQPPKKSSSKKKSKSSKKKSSKKSSSKKQSTRKSKRKKQSKSIINQSNQTQILSLSRSKKKYGIGNQGFALIIPNTEMSCTITEGPITADAVKLQSPSSSNLYQFWVRKEDIKKVLENKKLEGQRVKFELNGMTSNYKVIQEGEEKEFVKCFWKIDVKETWIDMNNFHTKLSSVAISESSSISNHNENSSNKENEGDQQDEDIDINHNNDNGNRVNVNHPNIRKTRKTSKSHRKSTESKEEESDNDDMDASMNGSSSRKRRRSKNNSNKNNKNTQSKRSKSKSNEASSKNPTPTPSLTLTSVSSASIKSEIAKEQTPVKTKANRRHRPKRQTLNRNAQSQPINRTMRHPPTRKAQAPLTGRQQTQRNQQSNTINQAQISTSCSRYQQLKHYNNNATSTNINNSQRNVSNHHRLLSSNNTPAYVQPMSHNGSITTEQALSLLKQATATSNQSQSNTNAFGRNNYPSPLQNQIRNNQYRYQQQIYNPQQTISGHKRSRNTNCNNQESPNKRRKVAGNSNGSNKNNNQQQVQLVAIQPPQPDIPQMPPLIPSATPKSKADVDSNSGASTQANNNSTSNSNNNNININQMRYQRQAQNQMSQHQMNSIIHSVMNMNSSTSTSTRNGSNSSMNNSSMNRTISNVSAMSTASSSNSNMATAQQTNVIESPFPNPSVSTPSSPTEIDGHQINSNLNNNNNKNKNKYLNSTADDVSSAESNASTATFASGILSESANINSKQATIHSNHLRSNHNQKIDNIGINVDVDNDIDMAEHKGEETTNTATTTSTVTGITINNHRNDVLSDTESEDSLSDVGKNNINRRNHSRNNNHNHNHNHNHNINKFPNHFLPESGPHNVILRPLSAPAPKSSSRYNRSSESLWYNRQNNSSQETQIDHHLHLPQLNQSPIQQHQHQILNEAMQIPMYYPIFSTDPLQQLTNKLMDKNCANKERIIALKSVLRYFKQCQNSMLKMFGQFGIQCNNVIRCVESMIKDLETHSNHT